MDALTFYVATDGDDSWPGRLPSPNAERTDGPFATLAGARDAIRELKPRGELEKPVTVLVRGGKYYLEETLVLSEEDSGTRDCPVTYAAYPGEKPILSGGRKVAGWEPYEGEILQCDLPGAKGGKWKFRQLFLNGQRQIRARYPNFDPENPLYGGWAFVEGRVEKGSWLSFRYKPGTFPRRWEKPTEAEINIYPESKYGNNIIPVKAVDWDRRIITVAHSGRHFDRYPWFRRILFTANDRFIVENVLEELDQPGEWCLDSEEAKLYFWPPTDWTEDAEVVAPVLDCLIDLRGSLEGGSDDPGLPRTCDSADLGGPSWITISGFTFTETTGGDNYHHQHTGGTGGWAPMENLKYCGDALHMRGAHHCCIEDNHFYAVGGNAVYLESYNERNAIRRNEISYAGAAGVCLLGSKYFRVVPRHPIYNRVEDNHIHHCGILNKYTCAVWVGLSQGNVIGHNLVEYLPWVAISPGASGYGRNIFEYNEIRHTSLEIQDTGAIMGWAMDPQDHAEKDAERSGHIIRYNLITDTRGCIVDEEGNLVPADTAANGIYLDDYTSNCFVYGNIVVGGGLGVYVHCGKNNVIENNIIVGSGTSGVLYVALHPSEPQMYGFTTGNRFCRNIVVGSGADWHLYRLNDSRGDLPLHRMVAQSDHNLFFNAGGELTVEEWSGRDDRKTIGLDEWQVERGFDTHSVIADPLFMDPEQEDFRLKPESPALKLGFQPIDASRIGIRDGG